MKILLKLISLFLVSTALYAKPTNELVIGFAPGGPSDSLARLLLDSNLGQEYFLVHKPGAGGTIGMTYAQEKKAPTLIVAENILVTNPTLLGDKIPYKVDDIQVVGIVSLNPSVLLCRSSLGFKTVDDIINYKQKLLFAVAVQGGIEELTTRVFFKKIQQNHNLINYTAGGNKQFIDLAGGHTDCAFGNLPSVLPFQSNAKVTPILATADINRVWKGIPTWESVYKEKFPFFLSMALAVDRSLPQSEKNKIIASFKNAYESKDISESLWQRGFIPVGIFGFEAEEVNNRNMRRFRQTVTDLEIKF